MAKRKRKRTASKRTKKKVWRAPARKKVAKRAGRKALRKKAAKRAAVKAKSKKRAARKKAAVPTMEARQQPAEAVAEIIETTVVDIVEEPAPGVVVVTEIETVETIKPAEDDEGSD
jgi:hypothetical protein